MRIWCEYFIDQPAVIEYKSMYCGFKKPEQYPHTNSDEHQCIICYLPIHFAFVAHGAPPRPILPGRERNPSLQKAEVVHRCVIALCLT